MRCIPVTRPHVFLYQEDGTCNCTILAGQIFGDPSKIAFYLWELAAINFY